MSARQEGFGYYFSAFISNNINFTAMKKCITALVCSVLLAVTIDVHAAGGSAPLWVTMMEDPNTNYYKAIEEYKNFWKTHVKPTGEADMDKGSEMKAKEPEEKIDVNDKEELQTARLADYYRYQCKRFEHWMRVNKPYVQKDGHILTADERLKLWEQTQKGK
jgi:hypothetical protein